MTYTCYVELGYQKVIDASNNWEYIQIERKILLPNAEIKEVLALAEMFIICNPDAVIRSMGNYDLFIELDDNTPYKDILMFYAKRNAE